jgi:hypothetical protein
VTEEGERGKREEGERRERERRERGEREDRERIEREERERVSHFSHIFGYRVSPSVLCYFFYR